MQSMNDAASKLNGLLKGEISAVETYNQAIDAVKDPAITSVLQDNRSCHADRAQVLTEKIVAMGGKPAQDSGVWGAISKIAEGGAKTFGEKSAIGVLEEGEDKGLDQYRKLAEDDDPAVRTVAQTLIDRQEGTHRKMSELKHELGS
ncbi:MAG TPA: DUF2383 domain-containing protein [Candidatus Obscuribacterales bacterium]